MPKTKRKPPTEEEYMRVVKRLQRTLRELVNVQASLDPLRRINESSDRLIYEKNNEITCLHGLVTSTQRLAKALEDRNIALNKTLNQLGRDHVELQAALMRETRRSDDLLETLALMTSLLRDLREKNGG